MYITASYDRVVKKTRKSGTPELRMLNYLDEEGVDKKYDERIFDNDMRITNALNKIKKKTL